MTIDNQTAVPRNAFIKSRKHGSNLPAPAIAMLATLALPLVAQAAPDLVIDQSIPTVQVTGANSQAPTSANQKFTAPLLDTPKSVTVVPAEIIAHPADDFVRSFVGLDKGARSLHVEDRDGVRVVVDGTGKATGVLES